MLVTSRVTSREIEQDYPWLRSDVEGPVEIIESLTGSSRIEAKGRAMEASAKLVLAPSGDAELEKLWLPDSLIEAFSRIGAGRPGMVVVDSWDALVEHYVGAAKPDAGRYPDRQEIERLMLGLLGRGMVHLVLVVEREGPTQLDYLVDGVIACVVSSNEDHLERWSHLKKMRGVRVNHAWYPYTLEGGRFLCIAPMPPEFRTRLERPQPEPDPKPGWIWPGSVDYATHFGRLQFGRTSLLEVDPEVPVEAIRLLVSPLQSQVLTLNGRVLGILPPSLSPGDVWDAFQPLISAEQFVTNVRLYAPSGLASNARNYEMLDKVMVAGPATEAAPMATRMPEASRFLREGSASGIPNLAVVWLTGLRAASAGGAGAYSPETFPGLIQKTLADSTTHIVMIGPPSDPLLDSLRAVASTRILIKARSGRMFLYGIQPLTPPLVLAQSDNGTPYHLIRIV